MRTVEKNTRRSSKKTGILVVFYPSDLDVIYFSNMHGSEEEHVIVNLDSVDK